MEILGSWWYPEVCVDSSSPNSSFLQCHGPTEVLMFSAVCERFSQIHFECLLSDRTLLHNTCDVIQLRGKLGLGHPVNFGEVRITGLILTQTGIGRLLLRQHQHQTEFKAPLWSSKAYKNPRTLLETITIIHQQQISINRLSFKSNTDQPISTRVGTKPTPAKINMKYFSVVASLVACTATV